MKIKNLFLTAAVILSFTSCTDRETSEISQESTDVTAADLPVSDCTKVYEQESDKKHFSAVKINTDRDQHFLGATDEYLYFYSFDETYSAYFSPIDDLSVKGTFNNGMVSVSEVINKDNYLYFFGSGYDFKRNVAVCDETFTPVREIYDDLSDKNFFAARFIEIGSCGCIMTYSQDELTKTFKVFDSDGVLTASLDPKDLPGYKTYWEVYDMKYTREGFLCVLVRTSEGNYIYMLDDELNFISQIMLENIKCPTRMYESGDSLIVNDERYGEDTDHYSIDTSQSSVNQISSLPRNASLCSFRSDTDNIYYKFDGDLYTFDPFSGSSTLIAENISEDIKDIFRVCNQIYCIISKTKTINKIIGVPVKDDLPRTEHVIGYDKSCCIGDINLNGRENVQAVFLSTEDEESQTYKIFNIDLKKDDEKCSEVTLDIDDLVNNSVIVCDDSAFMDNTKTDNCIIKIYSGTGELISSDDIGQNKKIHQTVRVKGSKAASYILNNNSGDDNQYIQEICCFRGDPSEGHKINLDKYGYARLFSSDSEYDVFFMTEEGVYGVIFENESITKILDLTLLHGCDADINTDFYYVDADMMYLKTLDGLYKVYAQK